MRFPSWAKADNQSKARYLLMLAALEVDRNGRLSELAKALDMPYETMLWAANNKVSKRIAVKVCALVPGLKIRPHWLMDPDLIVEDENGVVIE